MKTRHISRPFSFKTTPEGTLTGYGSVFGVEDHYSDIVMPGAFTRSLKERGLPKMLWQHNTDVPIGVWTSASEDEKGLKLSGQLAMKTQAGAEAHELLKMGALDGLSIGFSIVKAEYDDKRGIRKLTDVDLWEVSPVTFPANESARVTEVRAMTHSDVASLAAQIGKLHGTCKSCTDCGNQGPVMDGLDALVALMVGEEAEEASAGGPPTARILEAALRDAGLSREQAKSVLSKGLEALRDAASPLRDAGAANPEANEILSMVQALRARIRS